MTKRASILSRWENGDKDALDLWKRFRKISVRKYQETYARLNIHYDVYSGESQLDQNGINRATKYLVDNGISTEDQGAILIDFAKYGKKSLGKAIVRKTDGTSLYLTRDIEAAAERYQKYKFDRMIYVAAAQQEMHFKQLFTILKLMRYDWADRCSHVNFGMDVNTHRHRSISR